jgi:hypothetical protein
MAAHVLTVVCAWCHRIVERGPTGASVTHTICQECLDWTVTHRNYDVHGETGTDIGQLRLPPGYFGDAFKQ